jgi:hypothetical protein
VQEVKRRIQELLTKAKGASAPVAAVSAPVLLVDDKVTSLSTFSRFFSLLSLY